MLEVLRKGAATWVAKIFIAMLVLSFGIWGVADIFGGYGRRNVATVGDAEIPADQFQETLRRQLDSLRERVGRTLTMQEARSFGIDQQVLLTMERQAALDNQGAAMNIGISDDAIVQKIVRERAFQDSTGRFDKARFLQILQANGWSEGWFIQRQRETYVRQQLVQTVGEPAELPKAYLDAVNNYRNETRRLKYFKLGSDKIEPVGEPEAAALQKYYDDNKSSYAVPEMRKLGVLAVLPKDVAKTITVKDEDIKARYDNTQDTFRTLEKRQVRQISFPDEAAAKAAHEKIEAGGSFEDIARERDLSETDTNLGLVQKSDLIDPAVADAAFALKEGEVSAPVKGQFGTVIVKIEKIEPESVKSFEDARDGIRDTIAKERAVEAILDIHNQVEDERASGAGLAAVAKTLGLDYKVVEAVDLNGNGPDGKPVEGVPIKDELLPEAFATEQGVENDPLETADQGLVWYEIINVIARRIQPLDEVREKVSTDWRASEERKALANKARDLVKQAREGRKLEDIASGLEQTVSESEPLKRSAKNADLPPPAISQAFALAQDGYGSAASADGKQRIIFQVAAIESPPPMEGDESSNVAKSFGSQIADDIVTQYVTALVDSYGVTRNQALIDQIVGVSDNQTGLR